MSVEMTPLQIEIAKLPSLLANFGDRAMAQMLLIIQEMVRHEDTSIDIETASTEEIATFCKSTYTRKIK
jgi:hypothetical protein